MWQVRDGPDETADTLGRFCDEVPATISSTGNQMWIKFKSDVSIRGNGFRATYTTGRPIYQSPVSGIFQKS